MTASGQVTDVPAGSNLYTYINAATPENHSYNLLGDVNMNTVFLQNNSNKREIFIEGNGYTITKSANDRIFWITNGLTDARLTIRNANITSADVGGSYGTISVDLNAHNAIIDLDGTRIYGTRGLSGVYAGALATHAQNTVVKGNVSFEDNYNTGDGAGAVAVGNGANASLIFENKTNFSGNHTVNYGGAASVYSNASLIFKDDVTFTGNYVTAYFGGAIDAWSGNGSILFEKDATFTGNYARSTFAQAYGVRGGAINVGYTTGTDTPQLEMHGMSEFTGNYVWGYGATVGLGGAVALSSVTTSPLGAGGVDLNHIYGASFEQVAFNDNYAYSETGGGYGGAIFSKSRNGTLDFGSGSSFSGNMAKTLGGAIYFDQGTINLDGNITFSGNRQGVSFSTAGGTLTPDTNSGSANAIYFSVSSNTATLNLNAGSGETIHFADPIESAAGKTVTVNKTGSGTALFTGHDSDILAQTLVSEGTFELGAGVAYGRLGTSADSSFHLASGARLKAGNGSSLRASAIQLDGRLEVDTGWFTFEGADVVLSATSVVALTIEDIATYSSIDMGGNSLDINNAALEISATNYVPSQEISDTFTLVSNLADPASGMFLQGESIIINGAEFQILYNANSIVLQQLTAVPEPAAYALILASGVVGMICLQRRKRKLSSR